MCPKRLTQILTPRLTQILTPTQPLSHILSRRHNKRTALIFENNMYYRDSQHKVWRCQRRKDLNCKAACRIIDNKVIPYNIAHTHGPLSEEKVKLFSVVADAKKKAVDQPDEKPMHIVASSIKKNIHLSTKGRQEP